MLDLHTYTTSCTGTELECRLLNVVMIERSGSSVARCHGDGIIQDDIVYEKCRLMCPGSLADYAARIIHWTRSEVSAGNILECAEISSAIDVSMVIEYV